MVLWYTIIYEIFLENSHSSSPFGRPSSRGLLRPGAAGAGDCHPGPHRGAYVGAHRYADPLAYARSDPHAYPYAYADAHAHADAYAHADAHPHAHAGAHGPAG